MVWLLDAIAGDGFWILAVVALVAGIVRGLSGFAAAMVFLPVAAQMFSSFAALAILITMDLTSRMPHLPRVLQEAQRRDVVLLALGAVVAVPMGVGLLGAMAPDVFRYAVSAGVLLLVALLASKLRYRGRISDPVLYATGALSGFFAGSVGLPGALVVRLYRPVQRSDIVLAANIMFYLLICDALVLGMMQWNGYLSGAAVATGAVLVFPYLVGNVIGRKVFRTEFRQVYRVAAFVIAAASALISLPLFD